MYIASLVRRSLAAAFHRRAPFVAPVARGALAWAAVLALAALIAGCSNAPDTTPVAPDATPNTMPQQVDACACVEGVCCDRIVFGQSAAFSGPAQDLGWNMKRGIDAAFAEANKRGGVNGRTLELVSLDDSYEPEAAIANTMELIEEEAVFALIGAVGTPTSRSATPVAAAAGIPYVAPFTGAAFLRDPEWNNIINLRASYNQETEEMVAWLTEDLGIERIAVMYQDDSFGRAGYGGALAALERRGMEPVAIGLYPRNTTAVKRGLLDLQQGDPEAVILVGAYKPVAELIGWARFTGMDAIFMTVSFVGSNALSRELGAKGEGVYVTQVVPFPTDDSIPAVDSYLQALSDYSADAGLTNTVPGFVSFEGYLAGRLAIAALEKCGADVNRACFLSNFRGESAIDVDGFLLRYGDGDNQGSDEVFLTVIGADGNYRPVDAVSRSEN